MNNVAGQRINAAAHKWMLINLSLLIIGLPFSRAVTEIGIAGIILGWIIYRFSSKSDNKVIIGSKIERFFRKFRVECGIGVPLTCFVFVCMFSLTQTNHFYPESLRGVIKVIKYTFFCLAVIDTVNTRKRFNNLLVLILSVAFVISLNGLIQYFAGTDLIRQYPLSEEHRISSSFGNPNNLAGYLCMLIPLPICWLFFNRPDKVIKKILLGLVTGILSIAMVLSYSKGAWVGLGIALLMVFLVQIRRRKKRLFFLRVVAVGILFLFIFVFV